MKNKILFFLATLLLPFAMQANNIRVGIQKYDPVTKKLTINLAWDNSWSDGSGTFRDAAWVFIKYKDITDVEWRHAMIQNIPTNAVLTDTLSGFNVKLDIFHRNTAATNQNRGVIVRRSKPASGVTPDSTFTGVHNIAMSFDLSLYLPTGSILVNPEFKAFAIEMVDIPTAAFSVGDGSLYPSISTSSSSSIPKLITSEAGLVGLSTPTSSYFNVSAAFQKGVTEFFIMKYELSNEGWVEFLNTLTRTQQNGYFASLSSLSSGIFSMGTIADFSKAPVRGEVTGPSSVVRFYCDINSDGVTTLNDGQFLPAVMAGGNANEQVMAYLSWAGLRPITGYEYEKAARGTAAPVPDEYAWGSLTSTSVNTAALASPVVDRFGPAETTSMVFNGPIPIDAVVRCGFFAKPTGSTRLTSGGSFYGVMELSNNATEFTLGYGSSTAAAVANGTGILNVDGRADISSWAASPVAKIGRVSGSAVGIIMGIRGGIR